MRGRSPGLACTSRWRATACSSRPRPACTRSSGPPHLHRRPGALGDGPDPHRQPRCTRQHVAFAITLFAGIAVAAVFVLRSREPHAPRPFKAVGYPITPAIFVLFSFVMVVNAIYRAPLATEPACLSSPRVFRCICGSGARNRVKEKLLSMDEVRMLITLGSLATREDELLGHAVGV